MKVEYTDQARRDLRDISRFGLRMWSLEQVRTYVTALHDSISRLAAFPELGSVHRRDDSGAIRRLVHRQHVVFYTETGETLVILRVLSARAALPDVREPLDDL